MSFLHKSPTCNEIGSYLTIFSTRIYTLVGLSPYLIFPIDLLNMQRRNRLIKLGFVRQSSNNKGNDDYLNWNTNEGDPTGKINTNPNDNQKIG